MNPFDPKSAWLAKHAQHVVLVHFPIAAVSDRSRLLISWPTGRVERRWRQRPIFNIVAAAVSVLPALSTGVLAWQWQLAGQKPKGLLLLQLALGAPPVFSSG